MEKKKKHEFLVGIPTINRSDLLNEVLPKYFNDFHKNDIFIVDNGNQSIIERDEKFEIYRPNKNLGVAKSWNIIIQKALELGYQRVLILNDDVYLGKNRKEVESIIEKFYHGDVIHSTKNFCSFIISTFAFQMYDGFDENFYPAYFEDKDYMYRLKIEGGTGDVILGDALLSNQENTDVDSAAAEVVAQVSTTYTAAFFDFVVKKTTNVRSGTVYACHDGTTVQFTETSTQDLGDTSDVTLSVDILGTDMRLRATVTSDDWIIKSLIRAI